MDFGARLGEGAFQPLADRGPGLEKEEGVAFRAARADGGKLAQGFNELVEGGRVIGHETREGLRPSATQPLWR